MSEKFEKHLRRVAQVQTQNFVVSPDEYRVGPNGIYRIIPERESAIWAMAHRTFRALLSLPDVSKAVVLVGIPGAGKSSWLAAHKAPKTVYFDATMTRWNQRAFLIEIARQVGKPVDAVVMQTPWKQCVRRNATRTPDRRVPDHVLDNMAENLNREPVSQTEGFASVLHVR